MLLALHVPLPPECRYMRELATPLGMQVLGGMSAACNKCATAGPLTTDVFGPLWPVGACCVSKAAVGNVEALEIVFKRPISADLPSRVGP